jgi:uncharacterized protein YbjQ (UPF0145 family)
MNRILLLSVLLITMGCASSNFTSTSDLKYPEYKGAVKVFFNEPKEIKYDEIGIVAAEGALFSDDVEVIKSLQNKAAKEGANAIIIIFQFSGKTIKTEEKDNGVYISSDNERKMLAVAIRIKDK